MMARRRALTIRNDPAQLNMPGTEPTARQAQAARDATNGGRLGPKVPQKPADLGLFAEPDHQAPLFPLDR